MNRAFRHNADVFVTPSGQHLSIWYRTVGQNFGTVAELRRGRRIIAETAVRPFGFVAMARIDALRLMKTL